MSTSVPNWSVILDLDLPNVDVEQVAPTPEQVALLEPTRTIDETGVEQGAFTDTTRPTISQVVGLIAQAIELTLADMPQDLPEAFYPRIQQAVALQAALLIEVTFFREQADANAVKMFEDRYARILTAIETVSGGEGGGTGGGNRVDSIMARSSMAEYEPDYPMPPPRVMPVTPIPIDPGGDNADGGGASDGPNTFDGGGAGVAADNTLDGGDA